VTRDDDANPGSGEPPPFGGRWSVLYALVIAALAACIATLAWLSGRWR
jgi:hypothetical protein